jgi:hypothetical protein
VSREKKGILPPHVGEDLDRVGCRHARCSLALLVLVEDALEQACIAFGHFPVAAQFPQCLYEWVDGLRDAMVDRAAMDEKHASCDP